MDCISEDINEYNQVKNMLIVVDGMIADIITNKKFQTIVRERFIRCRKLNISYICHTVFFFGSKRSQFKFYTLFKTELQQIATNRSADIDYKDFMKIYRKCTSEPYSFLNIDTTLLAKDLLRKIFYSLIKSFNLRH